MQIIPVIDLMGGKVVRARMGNRAAYAPLQTKLARTSAPLDVVAGLLALHRFKTLYIADLDAIMGTGAHLDVILQLAGTFAGVRLWVDNGVSDFDAAQDFLARTDADLVIGSESQRDCGLIAAMRDNPRAILSLDSRGELPLGPQELLAQPKLWPQRVIVMTLARVGGDAGPDMARLAAIRAQAGPRTLIAAGGLRGLADAQALAAAGISGALVASALHDGRIGAPELDMLG